MDTKIDQAFTSRQASGPVFLTNFYGYVKFKDIRVIDILPAKAENIYKAYVFACVLSSLVLT